MDHLNKLCETSSQKQKVIPVQSKGPHHTDYLRVLKRYLVVKYIQYMILPSTNIVVLAAGAFGTLHVLVLLLSQTVSKKSTAVFISHLAAADAMLVPAILLEVCHQVVDIKFASDGFIRGLIHNLLAVNTNVSSLILSCISLEAFLITQFPVESRHIRTVRQARKTSVLVWITVLIECIILQTECIAAPEPEEVCLSALFQYFLLIAPTVRGLFDNLLICFRFLNVFFYYKVYTSKSHSRHSSNRTGHCS
ncbi:type-1 angiotensin II receptor-like [Stegostoma tigrinum]|uniref:type-1 angiotensin II receptor-like n=1 Tax=Stegostoma tigrinum TaxID=3053191 RepID=UPI00202ACCCE|nr:type-1 angiotensin II receptor-like [Stegostoma tigrinum]XP_048399972.1 type-1 angiotensin II receptor-like [Stegostoma tigrinum]XP_059507479.1 type-1 angiotensin II receptor-like [Stegostoma tigrinum]XP_059507480.1 type-1 angiotensin II receptor-like [Stegostoma tigrinum]XP_059507481.1 type-1 angiotensin II receptor-like [Stegostoma tigrinum]